MLLKNKTNPIGRFKIKISYGPFQLPQGSETKGQASLCLVWPIHVLHTFEFVSNI